MSEGMNESGTLHGILESHGARARNTLHPHAHYVDLTEDTYSARGGWRRDMMLRLQLETHRIGETAMGRPRQLSWKMERNGRLEEKAMSSIHFHPETPFPDIS